VRGAAGDLSTPAGVDAIAKEFPEVDILVNNIGAFEAKPFFAILDADWQLMWERNVMSGVRLSRYYMRGMLERNWGRVIFISSEAGLNLSRNTIHYGVTKTAVLGLSRALAELTVGTAVTVNAVLPSDTRTEATAEWIQSAAKEKGVNVAEVEKEYFEKTRPSSLIRRFAEPSEVAALVAFVASPLSAITNGAALRAEGGIIHSIG
jgi:NAD(P)-dependent dehydrogenase (short-subunit alcohol dehydrogenase family)